MQESHCPIPIPFNMSNSHRYTNMKALRVSSTITIKIPYNYKAGAENFIEVMGILNVTNETCRMRTSFFMGTI